MCDVVEAEVLTSTGLATAKPMMASMAIMENCIFVSSLVKVSVLTGLMAMTR